MSKSIGRVFGTGAISPYGYETDYMQYLRGYNPYNYEQTLQNMMPSALNVNVQPDYQLSVQNSVLQPEKTTVPFSEKPEEADARLRRMLNKIIDNVNQMNAYKESLYQPYNGYGNSMPDYNLTSEMQGSDYSLKLPEFDNSRNYTTVSDFGYPNSTSYLQYRQMGNPYGINQNSLYEIPAIQQPYILSEDMRNRLGIIESGNNYRAHNTNGGGFGALGKYQIRRDGFVDTGYLDKNYNWTGKNGILSIDDFLNSPEKQEQVLDEYLKSNYGQLKNKGSLNYLGTPMQGVVNNFDITNTGLLAASHREGAGAVNNYLKHLVKNQNGRYYIDYGNMSDKDLSDMFRRIETRLRNFEK